MTGVAEQSAAMEPEGLAASRGAYVTAPDGRSDVQAEQSIEAASATPSAIGVDLEARLAN